MGSLDRQWGGGPSLLKPSVTPPHWFWALAWGGAPPQRQTLGLTGPPSRCHTPSGVWELLKASPLCVGRGQEPSRMQGWGSSGLMFWGTGWKVWVEGGGRPHHSPRQTVTASLHPNHRTPTSLGPPPHPPWLLSWLPLSSGKRGVHRKSGSVSVEDGLPSPGEGLRERREAPSRSFCAVKAG